MTLSLERLLERGPALLDDVSTEPTLSAASRARLTAILGYALPVLDAPAPQRVGRLYDLLAFSEDPELARLAESWGAELSVHTPWVASLVAPDARPADWPHRSLAGSNPRLTRRFVGLDDGPSCRVESLSSGEVLATLPGRLLTIDDDVLLTHERGCVRCLDLRSDGSRERWRNPSVPQAITHALLAGGRALLLGGGHLYVLDGETGEPIAVHQRDGMRGLVRVGAQAWLVTERALHTIAPDGETHAVFESVHGIAAAAASERTLFVTEYWERVVALDATTHAEQWSAKVRAQYAGLAVSRDGARVAVCSAKSTDPVASIFEASDGSGRVDLEARGHASHAAFDASGTRLFVQGAVFDAASGARIGVLAGRGGAAHSVQASDDGEHLVALSPRGVVRFAGAPSIVRSVTRQAQPAWRAVLCGSELLTDGGDTGFERWSLDGTFLDARPERLVGVLEGPGGNVVIVEREGRIDLFTRDAERWISRFQIDGAAWCARGLDGFVVHRSEGGVRHFEVRDRDGALRFGTAAGEVRAALSIGLWVERDGRSIVVDARKGETLATLGVGAQLVASEGGALASLHHREHDACIERWDGEPLARRWSIAVPPSRMGTTLELEGGHVVLTRNDLDPGTEQVVIERVVFDGATGAVRDRTERIEGAGPGMTTTRLGALEARVVGGTTSVVCDGTLVATLPVPLELAQLGDRTLLIGPRGPSVYEVRGRLPPMAP